LVYKLLEFMGLADDIRCAGMVRHGWIWKNSAIGLCELGMIFLAESFAFLVNWRLKNFFGQD
jgi:hypothetical protein